MEGDVPEAVRRAATAEAGCSAAEVVGATALAIGSGIGLGGDGSDQEGGDGEELHFCRFGWRKLTKGFLMR